MADFLDELLDGSAPEPDAADGSAQDGPAQQRLDLGVCKRAPGGGPTALRGRRRQAMQPGPGGRLQRGSAAAKKQHILMTIGKLRTVDNISVSGFYRTPKALNKIYFQFFQKRFEEYVGETIEGSSGAQRCV